MRTLIFATTYIDTAEKAHLFDQWLTINRTLNRDCDLLVVDSCSPIVPWSMWAHWHNIGQRYSQSVFSFEDNIGHLTRTYGGKDGWGRAFCYGLDAAVAAGYEFAAHIEGDLLCSLPVLGVVTDMIEHKTQVLTTKTAGGPPAHWIETGLMFFNVDWLKRSRFTERYDWRKSNRGAPEQFIQRIIGPDLRVERWPGLRNDMPRAFTVEQLDQMPQLCWLTHCKDARVYDRFVERTLEKAHAVAC